MKECKIRIEYPDLYSNDEIIKVILGQIDINSLNKIGIKLVLIKKCNLKIKLLYEEN